MAEVPGLEVELAAQLASTKLKYEGRCDVHIVSSRVYGQRDLMHSL
jgi:hypothetical protein